MQSGGISIWFFVGASLLVNGLLILGAGIYEFVQPPEKPVVLFQLHANVWWGGVLVLAGILYCVFYAPGRNRV
jgi:FtsH-binding integral membrane protein